MKTYRPDGVTLEQIAADFGVHPMTLSKCLRNATVEDGSKPGVTRAECQRRANTAPFLLLGL